MYDIKQLRILFVDDMQTIRFKIRKCLEHLGATQFDEAENGKVALAMLEQAAGSPHPFNLVISDWNMPEMDGIVLLNTIRNHTDPIVRRTRFVMITGKPENIMMALDHGANQYFHKPFSEDDIAKRLEWIFG